MDYLSQDEQEQLKALRRLEPFVEESLQQLDRILASLEFRGSHEHAQNFLRFIVVKQLLRQAADIKETTVAVHVFGESADYDPKEHTKVRVAAGSLRRKLERYYKDEGRDDAILITIPVGTYVPDIRDRRWRVAVGVFENWNARRDHEHLCHATADEITHRLGQMPRGFAQRVTRLDADGDLHEYGLRGSLECSRDRLRVNYSLSDLRHGLSILSDYAEGHRNDLLKLSQKVAAAVAAELQRRQMAEDNARQTPAGPIRRRRDPRIRPVPVQAQLNVQRPDVA
jgi:TolB-like protein